MRGKSGNCVGPRFSVRVDQAWLKTNPHLFYPPFPLQPGPIFVAGLGKVAGGWRFSGIPDFFIKFAESQKTRPKPSPAGPNYSEAAFKSGKNVARAISAIGAPLGGGANDVVYLLTASAPPPFPFETIL